MKHIAQIGTFDVENFGDLLFPYVLQNKLGNDYTIDLFSPNGGDWCFFNKKVYPIAEFEKMCQKNRYDAIIIGGGDLIRTDNKIFITENLYSLSDYPSLQLWVYPILVSKKYNIPIIFNSLGVPNDFDIEEIPFLRTIFSLVDDIVVRDEEAKRTLENIGLKNVRIIPDSVITISDILSLEELDKIYKELINNNIIPNIDNYIIFQHNSTGMKNEYYYNKIVDAVKHISNKHKVLLMPIGYVHYDDKILKKIYDEKIDNVYITTLNDKLTPLQMISIISHSSGYIGTSMHGAVVSYSYNKPLIILNFMNAKKLNGFAKISGYYDCDINNIDLFDYYFDNRFGKIKPNSLDDIKKIINDNFKLIKKIIDDDNQNVDFNVTQFMSNYHFEQNIIGSICKNINNLLDRKIYQWVRKNELYEISVEDKDFYLTISNHRNTFIYDYNFEVKEFGDAFFINDKLFVPKGSYIRIVTNSKVIKSKIIYNIEEDLINIIKKMKFNVSENMIKEYQKIEKKYINLLTKK